MEEGLENCAHQGKMTAQNRTGQDVPARNQEPNLRLMEKNNMRENIESMLTYFTWGN